MAVTILASGLCGATFHSTEERRTMAHGPVEPFRIGFLNEGLFDDEAFDLSLGRAIRLRFEEAYASGLIDRPVELVLASGYGLPSGTARAVEDAWMQLKDAGVLGIMGPGITDNCIAVKPLFEHYKVATINFPGTVLSRGEYGFHYQLGALYEDGPICARAIARSGLTEVAVIRDRGPIGGEYFEYFVDQCEMSGLSVISDQVVSPIATDLTAQVAKAKAANPQALVYLGFGGILSELSQAIADANLTVPRYTCTAGLHWYSKTPEERAVLQGWTYVDMVDEENPVMQHMMKELRSRWDMDGFNPIFGVGYDMATLAVLGLHYAPVYTTEGFKEGLEKIHHVPSVLGAKGTVMGFGPHERTALKGPDYLLLREMGVDSTTRYQG